MEKVNELYEMLGEDANLLRIILRCFVRKMRTCEKQWYERNNGNRPAAQQAVAANDLQRNAGDQGDVEGNHNEHRNENNSVYCLPLLVEHMKDLHTYYEYSFKVLSDIEFSGKNKEEPSSQHVAIYDAKHEACVCIIHIDHTLDQKLPENKTHKLFRLLDKSKKRDNKMYVFTIPMLYR